MFSSSNRMAFGLILLNFVTGKMLSPPT